MAIKLDLTSHPVTPPSHPLTIMGMEYNPATIGSIGGKSYGTREQCSQKLFELTENIRKISLF
jgi:hypothetical protein